MQIECETLSFSTFTLDTKRRTLLSNTTQVPLHARAFDILVYLIEHRDRPVSHTEITARVWSGRVVSDNNLSVQISNLRRALSEAGEARPLILTLPERHYRFVGEVDAEGPKILPQENGFPPVATFQPAAIQTVHRRRRRGLLYAGIVSAVLLSCAELLHVTGPAKPKAPRLSVVVLPFRNASPDRTQDYLADAITDDLTADLARVPASTVIARASAEALRNATPPEVGRALNVRYILSGTIAPEDGTFHVTAYLTEAATAQELWTAQFDAPRDRLSDIREEIVHHIASPLHLKLNALASTQAQIERPDNPDAVDLFFRARSKLDGGTSPQAFNSAEALLKQSIAKQPDFLDAKALLGDVLLRTILYTDDPNEDDDFNRADITAHQVLAAEPQNASALSVEARVQQINGRLIAAESFAKRALEADPSSIAARTVLADCAQRELHFDEAIRQYQNILQLDPANSENSQRYLTLGAIELITGHPQNAITYLARADQEKTTPAEDFDSSDQALLFTIAADDEADQVDKAKRDYAAYANHFGGRSTWRVGNFFRLSWRTLPGYRMIMSALQNAGMPAFADENSPGPQADAPCKPGDFAPTPMTISGGTMLKTSELEALLSGPNLPLVISVGRPGITPTDWLTYDVTATTDKAEEFAKRAAATGLARKRRIVILGDGVTGCLAYNTASALIRSAYTPVYWYRGGREAWDRYHQPSNSVLQSKPNQIVKK